MGGSAGTARIGAGLSQARSHHQADAFNRSRISTVLALVLTTNLRLVDAPGNVLIPAKAGGLSKDSVANVSQLITIDRSFLDERAGRLQARYMAAVDAGLKLVLALT